MNYHTAAGSHHFLLKVVMSMTYDFSSALYWRLNNRSLSAVKLKPEHTRARKHTHTTHDYLKLKEVMKLHVTRDSPNTPSVVCILLVLPAFSYVSQKFIYSVILWSLHWGLMCANTPICIYRPMYLQLHIYLQTFNLYLYPQTLLFSMMTIVLVKCFWDAFFCSRKI